MRLAQSKERFALLTIGEDKNKKKFQPIVENLRDLGFQFYATEYTHEFYKQEGIESILLHKMYKKTYPSLEDILRQNIVDLIIDIPYDKQLPESKKDEAIIRKWAVNNDVTFIRDFETAEKLLEKMKKHMVLRKKGGE